MQHPFRGMNELTAARGRRHVGGGDVGLVICVEFISHSNLHPPAPKTAKISYLCHTLPINWRWSLGRCLMTEVVFFFSANGFRIESMCTSAWVSVSYCCVDRVVADVQMWDSHQEVTGFSSC